MPDFNKAYLYRITHIENIPHMLQYGITHASSPNANLAFVTIGDKSLIKTRSQFVLNNSKPLGRYIPFYFGPRIPMLFVIQKGHNLVNSTPAEDIVYFVSTVQQIMINNLGYIFRIKSNCWGIKRIEAMAGNFK